MSSHNVRYRVGHASAAAMLLLLSGCAVNPATGGRMFSLVSEGQEVEMGQQAMHQVDQAFVLIPISIMVTASHLTMIQ